MSLKTINIFLGGALLAGFVVYFGLKAKPELLGRAPSETVQAAPSPVVIPMAEPEPVPTATPPALPPEPQPSTATREAAARPDTRTAPPASTPPVPRTLNLPASRAPQPSVAELDAPPDAVPPALPAPAITKQLPNVVLLKAGTLIPVRLDAAMSSGDVAVGDQFTTSLDAPLVVNGFVIAERGARVDGKVVSVDPGGRVKGRASVGIQLFRLRTSDRQTVRINTETFTARAGSGAKSDAVKVGVGSAIGAAIGAMAGGGRGAAIGAAAGAGAGGGVVLATRGPAAKLDPETRISFRLAQTVSITEKRSL